MRIEHKPSLLVCLLCITSFFTLINHKLTAHAHDDDEHEGHRTVTTGNYINNNNNMDMDMDMDMNMDTDTDRIVPIAHEGGHHHGMPILEMGGLTVAEKMYWEQYNTTTYFTFENPNVNKGFMWVHVYYIALLTIFIYPILLSLNNIGNKWFLLLLSLNYVVAWISCISLFIFHKSLERENIELYPNNILPILTVLLMIFLTIHLISAFVKNSKKFMETRDLYESFTYDRLNYYSADNLHDNEDVTTTTNNNNGIDDDNRFEMSSYDIEVGSNSPHSTLRHSNENNDHGRNDSNNTKTNSDSNTRSNSYDIPFHKSHQKLNEIKNKRDNLYKKVYSLTFLQKLILNFYNLFNFCFNALNYPILFYLFVYCGIGLAIGNLYGLPKNRIFNILAHWIKGGVFIILGIVSLSRYCGFGSKKSWSWNTTIITKKIFEKKNLHRSGLWRFLPKSGINMDFIETFLIFFYGSTNVFLEHLAAEDNTWTAKDLQHVSIAFMYIGAGLCGLLVEYYLDDWKYQYAIKHMKNMNNNNSNNTNQPNSESVDVLDFEHQVNEDDDQDVIIDLDDEIVIANPGFSPNPLPAFTIFWTGVLMSKHAQASAVSTAVHVQWGNLLAYGSFFRIFTILYMFLIPNYTPLKPSRPLTELITSFCLLCGGLVFMESTDQVIEGMEYRGYTEMFTFNISVGLVTLVMSWIMILFIWKDWLKKRQVN